MEVEYKRKVLTKLRSLIHAFESHTLPRLGKRKGTFNSNFFGRLLENTLRSTFLINRPRQRCLRVPMLAISGAAQWPTLRVAAQNLPCLTPPPSFFLGRHVARN